jgi:hypothetical protein
MTSLEGAWVQAADENAALFLLNGNTLDVDEDAERQELVRRVSSVTADGRRFAWPNGTSVCVLDAPNGTYDVVLEAPRTDYEDSSGRRVLATLLLGSVAAAEAETRLIALRQTIADRGVALVAPPTDIGVHLRGLAAAGRRGCLPLHESRRLIRRV